MDGWGELVCSQRKPLDKEQPRLIRGGVAMLSYEAEPRVLVLCHFLVRLVPLFVLILQDCMEPPCFLWERLV